MRFSSTTRRFVVLLLAVLMLCSVCPIAHAAPMTYSFQATVGSLPPFNSDVGLPFTLVEGSVIDGRLTIDPELGERRFVNAYESVQPHSIELSFDGFSFSAEMYQADVVNDSAIIPFGGDPIPADFVTLSCSSDLLAADSCNSRRIEFSGSEPLALGVNIRFAGDPAILPTPEIPSSTIQWNQFSIRRNLTFIFVTPDIQVEGFDANISSFQLVPEPSSSLLALTLLTLALIQRTRNYIRI